MANKNINKVVIAPISANPCEEFLALATSEKVGGAGDHYADKVKNYCLDLMG